MKSRNTYKIFFNHLITQFIVFFLLSFFSCNASFNEKEQIKMLAPHSLFETFDFEKIKLELHKRGAFRLAQSIDPLLRYFEELSKEDIIKYLTPVVDAAMKSYNVHQVYGLGFPFYINKDDSSKTVVGRRIYRTIRAFLDKSENMISEVEERKMMTTLLPDYDILIIYDSSDYGPWRIGLDMNKKIADNFLKRTWRYFVDGFIRNIKKYNESAANRIKLHIGDVDQDSFQKLIEPYLNPQLKWKDALIHLDLLTVPIHIWEASPLLILDSDIQNFYFLRDILFTSSSIIPMTSEVVLNYRNNFLLQTLRQNKGKVESFSELFEKILSRHPYRELIKEHPEIFRFTFNLWKNVFNESITKQLINKSSEGNIFITNRGDLYLNEVLREREKLLNNGFVLQDKVQTWNLSQMMKKAA